MPDLIDKFLRHRPKLSNQTPLGRVYGVTRQSWKLDADPSKVAPETLVVASGRAAAEAADIARQEATDLPRHGFHKPSGAWWGVKDGRFHRFVVAPRRRGMAIVLAGLAGFAALALARQGRRPRRRRAPR